MLFPHVFVHSVLHREEWGALRIRPGYLRRAFRSFASLDLRPGNTRFFPHAPALEKILEFMEKRRVPRAVQDDGSPLSDRSSHPIVD